MLRIWGDEDRATSGRRRRALSAAMTSDGDVVADLSGLQFADSSVMVDLALMARRLRAEGRTLRLRGAQPQVRALIDMMGLARLAPVTVAES